MDIHPDQLVTIAFGSCLPKVPDSNRLRGIPSDETRPPRNGEWFIDSASGRHSYCCRANYDFEHARRIAKLVYVEAVIVSSIYQGAKDGEVADQGAEEYTHSE